MRQNNNVWLRIDQCSGAYHVLLFSWIIDCWKRICVCLRERERALAWSGYGAFIWAQGRWKGWVHRQDVPLVIPVSALVWSVADFGVVFRLTVVHIGLFSALMSGRRTSCGIEHLQPRPRSEPSPLPFEHNYSTQINYCYYMVVLCFYQMCSLSGCWSHRVFPLIFPQWWDFFFSQFCVLLLRKIHESEKDVHKLLWLYFQQAAVVPGRTLFTLVLLNTL